MDDIFLMNKEVVTCQFKLNTHNKLITVIEGDLKMHCFRIADVFAF